MQNTTSKIICICALEKSGGHHYPIYKLLVENDNILYKAEQDSLKSRTDFDVYTREQVFAKLIKTTVDLLKIKILLRRRSYRYRYRYTM